MEIKSVYLADLKCCAYYLNMVHNHKKIFLLLQKQYLLNDGNSVVFFSS